MDVARCISGISQGAVAIRVAIERVSFRLVTL
jgi:hypothetical protein